MHAWLKATFSKLSRKSDVAVAIHYALERWTALLLFAEDGRVETITPPNALYVRSRWDAIMRSLGLCAVRDAEVGLRR